MSLAQALQHDIITLGSQIVTVIAALLFAWEGLASHVTCYRLLANNTCGAQQVPCQTRALGNCQELSQISVVLLATIVCVAAVAIVVIDAAIVEEAPVEIIASCCRCGCCCQLSLLLLSVVSLIFGKLVL